MKKQNSRFRSGGSNNQYTLNYKFDSVSIAGKISGTALDLIRKYNDLAKEAQGSGNYVDMEIYRQYAEHYRKIVTDINERRQQRYEKDNRADDAETTETPETEEETEANENQAAPVEATSAPNGYVETLPAAEQPAKSFHVVEINETEEAPEAKPKRVYRRRTPITRKKAAEA